MSAEGLTGGVLASSGAEDGEAGPCRCRISPRDWKGVGLLCCWRNGFSEVAAKLLLLRGGIPCRVGYVLSPDQGVEDEWVEAKDSCRPAGGRAELRLFGS